MQDLETPSRSSTTEGIAVMPAGDASKLSSVLQIKSSFAANAKTFVQRALGLLGYGLHRTETLETLRQQLQNQEVLISSFRRAPHVAQSAVDLGSVPAADEKLASLEAHIGSLEEERDRYAREARFRHHIQVDMIRYFVQGRREWLSIEPKDVEYEVLDVDQVLAHPPIEPDFSVFSCFDDPLETILDLGANTGLAASSIFQAGCRAAVLSFEPNPLHHRILAQLRVRLPHRFDFVPFGLSSSRASLRFFTPVIEGRGLDPLTTAAPMAELDWGIPENILIHCMQHLPDVLVPRIQFCEQDWHVDTLDMLLKEDRFGVPVNRIAALKMDLEGHESEAIKGARETIEYHTPLIMIEGANRVEAVDRFLRALGYIYADFRDGQLVVTDAASPRVNGFYLHSVKLDMYAAKALFAPAKSKLSSGACNP
jgi:FkbM family methyltransferase